MTMKSVLIVDDSESDQFYLSELLEEIDEGIQVNSAYDGAEALAAVESMSAKPDLILLDLNMPGMNGFGFLEAYSNTDLPKSTVVVLSSSEQNSDVTQAKSYACVSDFLVKPIDFDKLEALVAG
jgi:CheY-like chemotaxis protein